MSELLPPVLIFDLDGTLTDSKAGILGCLRKVLDDRSLPYSGSLDRFIGPPVEEWVKSLLPSGTDEDHVALAREYRACYDREGWSNNTVYAGIREMLDQLRAAGIPLYVCTSKQEHFAVRILDAFELSSSFVAIYGDKAEYASHSKVDLLARLLQERALAPEFTWMVGDRSYDIEAAHANGLRCLAAGWGYGSPQEWAQANAVAATPADVFANISRHASPIDISLNTALPA
ncbi:MAG TPA: HAD hydrolase-like protein [Terracidiphilus sp.]|nr:HAD hydrolase-like protein [Terracidiphilus sp.]